MGEPLSDLRGIAQQADQKARSMTSKRTLRFQRLRAFTAPLGSADVFQDSRGVWVYKVKCGGCWIEEPRTDRFPRYRYRVLTRGRPMQEIYAAWLLHLNERHPEYIGGRRLADYITTSPGGRDE